MRVTWCGGNMAVVVDIDMGVPTHPGVEQVVEPAEGTRQCQQRGAHLA
jgi:hypothetical protein